jgi:hypothetical protein
MVPNKDTLKIEKTQPRQRKRAEMVERNAQKEYKKYKRKDHLGRMEAFL